VAVIEERMQSITPLSAAAKAFENGNYALAAMQGSDEEWQTYAAQGVIGKTAEAVEGLERFGYLEEARFYAAVAHWIGGDEAEAVRVLEDLQGPYARNLLAIISKPTIRVLAQLPWNRLTVWNLLTVARPDSKFDVQNISFHPDDLPNEPYANVHRYYDPRQPLDFYVCNMVEWHAIPPNVQELNCPIFGHTGDYDLHIQTVFPWLQLFDEVLVSDSHEWNQVSRLVRAPVSTFPKSFAIPDTLPPIPTGAREIDFFLSGTMTHPYHPDKADLLWDVLQIPGLRLKIVHGFLDIPDYYQQLANAKVCCTYSRHLTALPTRGLEALSMGCALVVEKGSVLSLFVGEKEGVLPYEFAARNIAGPVRHILGHWPQFEKRAQHGAEVIRREFAASRIASQYLRYLAFLAAKPRGPRATRPTDRLLQKRSVLEKGWLPSYDLCGSPILHQLAASTHDQLQQLKNGVASSHVYIDLTRESVLYNFHRALHGRIPRAEWLKTLHGTFHEGLARFPRSLVLRFNFIRTFLHLGLPQMVVESVQLLQETLGMSVSHWHVDAMEDVFPYDFAPTFFNYRKYLDLITERLVDGRPLEADLVRLILASLHYYLGFYSDRYQGFYSASLEHFEEACTLDPDFPYYRLYYADYLLKSSLPWHQDRAVELLTQLAEGSQLFLEAYKRLEQWWEGRSAGVYPRRADQHTKNGRPARPPRVESSCQRLADVIRRARETIENFEPLPPAPLQPSQDPPPEVSRVFAERDALAYQIREMESSKFWKLRRLWFLVKRTVRR
jgi:tetratricopeptide (TPR) repeat protein